MRRILSIVSGALLAVTFGIGTSATAAPADHGGLRVVVATATFADPADCADGQCEALSLAAGSGVLGAASGKQFIDGIVVVTAYPAVIEEGMLWQAGEPTLSACTLAADVSIDRELRSGEVSTQGLVELRDYVEFDDGSFECGAPNGHWIDLTAAFVGFGEVQQGAYHDVYSGPGATAPSTRQVGGGSVAVRAASVDAAIELDGAAVAWPPIAGSSLQRASERSLVVLHDRLVGPPARPLQITPNVDLMRMAIGSTGDWQVWAMVKSGDGLVGTTFGIEGMYEGQPAWGERSCVTPLEPVCASPVVGLADDVSTASAEATITLYTGSHEEPEVIGDVQVVATWAGTGDAWRFTSNTVSRSSEGNVKASITGIHRDAVLSLTVDGETSTGEFGYLEAFTIKQAQPSS